MDTPILAIASRLNLQSAALLAGLGAILIYFLLTNKVYGLIFFLIITTAFIGSSFGFVADISSLARWMILLILPLPGLFIDGRMKISLGALLFLIYAFVGFVSLLNARLPVWQIQRGALLMFVAISIPLAYGYRNYKAFKSSLTAVAVAASLFSIFNFATLPGSLSSSQRFSGLSSAAPNFTVTLGGLLPFSYWGLCKADSKAVRILCGLGLLSGAILLIFSGQRTGTLAGLISLLPLIFESIRRKNASASMGSIFLLLGLLLSTGYLVFHFSNPDRIEFLLSRYSLNAGLSNRDLIWHSAFDAIGRSPILGYGVGAAESLIASSFHNSYLEVWFNTGILGLFFYVAAQVYYLYRIMVVSSKNRSPEVRFVLALSLGYMLGFAAMCMFESIGAAASGLNLILYLFLGVLVSSGDLFTEDQQSESSHAGIVQAQDADTSLGQA